MSQAKTVTHTLSCQHEHKQMFIGKTTQRIEKKTGHLKGGLVTFLVSKKLSTKFSESQLMDKNSQ